MNRPLCTALAIAVMAVPSACDHSAPLAPSEPVTSAVTAVRYERVKPVIGEDRAAVVVTIWYALAPGDPYNRTSARLCALERTGATTFVCPGPRFEAIPTGREWSAVVTDAAVSALPVARDLYLNGSRIRVETFANGAESGHFQIDAHGNVS